MYKQFLQMLRVSFEINSTEFMIRTRAIFMECIQPWIVPLMPKDMIN